MQTNELLLARAKKGDPQAFEALVTPYERQVYFTCLKLMGDPQSAEDCAQEAMLRAFRSLKQYRGESAFSTWMYKVAYSACLDAMRKQKRRPQESLDTLTEAGFTPPSHEAGPYEALEKKERLAVLRAAIAALPEDLRQTLVLSQLENLSYEEVAAMTGVALGTVKSRVNRAREKLKQILTESRELFPAGVVQLSERRASK